LFPDIFVNFCSQSRWPQWLLVWQSISCSTFSELLLLLLLLLLLCDLVRRTSTVPLYLGYRVFCLSLFTSYVCGATHCALWYWTSEHCLLCLQNEDICQWRATCNYYFGSVVALSPAVIGSSYSSTRITIYHHHVTWRHYCLSKAVTFHSSRFLFQNKRTSDFRRPGWGRSEHCTEFIASSFSKTFLSSCYEISCCNKK
jgi:hypothetical protein